MHPLACPSIGTSISAAAPCGLDELGQAIIPTIAESSIIINWDGFAIVWQQTAISILTLFLVAFTVGSIIALAK